MSRKSNNTRKKKKLENDFFKKDKNHVNSVEVDNKN